MPSTRAQQGSRPRPATPTDVSAAIAERRRREQRRRQRMMFLAAGVLVAALLCVWLVRFSPLLAVRAVEVRGASQVSQADVVTAARVPLGQPLVSVDTTAIGQRVAGQLLGVDQVRVSTSLPGTVVIDVTERSLVYTRRSGAAHQWVDASGVVFRTTPGAVKGAVVAETASVDNRLLADVATVVRCLPAPVRARLQVLQATSPDQITLQLDKGQKVFWGSAAASEVKAQVVTVLLTQKATVFDVSSPAHPSAR